MSTKKNSKNISTLNSGEADHEKVLAERDELKDEVTRKNKEIEKLRTGLESVREHLSKAIECLQESTAAAASTANGHNKNGSPKTPKPFDKPARKIGHDRVLKRSATDMEDHESSKSHPALKRSSRSAPDKRTHEDS